MDILLTILSAGLVSGLMSIATLCLQRHWHNQDKKKDKNDAQAEALKVILIDRVSWLGKSYISHGEIEIDDKQNLKAMHKAAQGLGLNGDLDTIMQEVEKLPIAV